MISIMDSQFSTPGGEMPFLFPIGRNHLIHGIFLKQEGQPAEQLYSRIGYFQLERGHYKHWTDRITEILRVEKTISLI
jgi:hypothetical protein